MKNPDFNPSYLLHLLMSKTCHTCYSSLPPPDIEEYTYIVGILTSGFCCFSHYPGTTFRHTSFPQSQLWTLGRITHPLRQMEAITTVASNDHSHWDKEDDEIHLRRFSVSLQIHHHLHPHLQTPYPPSRPNAAHHQGRHNPIYKFKPLQKIPPSPPSPLSLHYTLKPWP